MELTKGMVLENKNAKGQVVTVEEIKGNKVTLKYKNNRRAELTVTEINQNYKVKEVEEVVTETVKETEVKEDNKTKKQEAKEKAESKKQVTKAKKMKHMELLEKVVEEAKKWECVVQKDTPDYIGLRVGEKGRMFAEISANSKFGKVLISPVISEETEGIWEGTELENTNGLRVRKVPESFGWTLRDIFELTTEEQIEPMLHYLKIAYEGKMELYKAKIEAQKEKERKKAEKEAKKKAKEETVVEAQ